MGTDPTSTSTVPTNTSTSVDLTPIIENQKQLIFLNQFECALIFAVLVFFACHLVLGRFLKK